MAVLVLLAAAFSGCSRGTVLGPAAADAAAAAGSKGDASQVVIVGEPTVIAVCDYPSGFIGPLPKGHCRADGSFAGKIVLQMQAAPADAFGVPAPKGDSDGSAVKASAWRVGDPTADD